MKNTLIVLLTISFLYGCQSKLVEKQATTTFYGVDFSKYTGEGFLITPYQYNEKYSSIGMLTATSCPEVSTAPGSFKNRQMANGQMYFVGEVDLDKTIEKLVKKATDMGADAIIDFSIKHTTYRNGTEDIPCIEVSGFAINRNHAK